MNPFHIKKSLKTKKNIEDFADDGVKTRLGGPEIEGRRKAES